MLSASTNSSQDHIVHQIDEVHFPCIAEF